MIDGMGSVVLWSNSWKCVLTAHMEMGGTDGSNGAFWYPGYGEKV